MLHGKLADLYWKGVEWEAATAIMAMADIMTIHPDLLPGEEDVVVDLRSERFGNLVEVWDPTQRLNLDLKPEPGTRGAKRREQLLLWMYTLQS